jgi:hypothetical protein
MGLELHVTGKTKVSFDFYSRELCVGCDKRSERKVRKCGIFESL